MAKLRVGVLFGGQSVEHEISLLSAQSVMRSLDQKKYEVIPLGITKEGKWLPPSEAPKLLETSSGFPDLTNGINQAPAGIASLVTANKPLTELPKLDVIFPLLHGTFGEDGTVQGLLELADVPYVGAGVLGSALGMDKALMKRVFRDAGLPIVPFITVLRRDWERKPEAIAAEVDQVLGFPCFVKPANGGSSVGISKVHARNELATALDTAVALDRKALVEEAIPGRELECSVLGNDAPIASAVGEIVPAREFYDYEAKYHDEQTQLMVPAPLPSEMADRVRALAVEAYQAIDCAGMARVDFFLRSADQQLFINEINTIPGFTSVSMYPKMWEAAGLPYSALLDRLIELALERHQEKRRNRYNYAALYQKNGSQGAE